MNLPELIDKSEKSEAIKLILDKAVKNIFGDRKPLTEILDRMEKDHTEIQKEQV